MKTFRLLSAIGIIAVILSGCKGETGPAGPAGTNGAANISSNFYTITPAQWVPASGGYIVTETDATISNANADGVEVFGCETGSNGPWLGLPAPSALAAGDVLEYIYSTGQIEFGYLYSSPPAITLYFKVVVIPPGVMKQHPNTNWHDYEQVNAILKAQSVVNQ